MAQSLAFNNSDDFRVGTTLLAERLGSGINAVNCLTLQSNAEAETVPEELLFQLLGCVGSLPLASLTLLHFGYPIPAAQFAAVIDQTKGSLTKLKLTNTQFVGNLDCLCTSIGNHPKLQHVRIQGLTVLGDEPGRVVPFLSAIGSCPNLQRVHLDFWANPLPQCPLVCALKKISSSPHLEELRLRVRPVTGLIPVCKILETNTTIRDTCLDAGGGEKELSERALAAIGRMLQSNSAVETFYLCAPPDCLTPIAQGLTNNQSLRFLRIFDVEGVPIDVAQTFANMAEQNYTVERLGYDHDEENWQDESIPLYTKLNRAGRKKLLEDPYDREEWVETLHEHKEDTEVVFWFLSKNPGLLVAPTNKSCSGSRPKKRQKTKDCKPTSTAKPPAPAEDGWCCCK